MLVAHSGRSVDAQPMRRPLLLLCGATGAICNGHRFLSLQATEATGGPRRVASGIGQGLATGAEAGRAAAAAGTVAAGAVAPPPCDGESLASEFCAEEVAQTDGVLGQTAHRR